ncbi:MAG: multidrug DMT transporter permease [Anaerolineae bacterium]|nr:multidrug DMT transporter permease [Anaerolineae bacterium]
MTLTAVILILISAGTHAGWNLIGKREHPSAAFLLLANTLGFVWLAPALLLFGRALPAFPAAVWGWLIVTGLCQALYYAALAGAYRAGDMSVAYPLARSTPVVLVAAFNLILGRTSRISVLALAGIPLIVLGGLLLPLRRFSDLRPGQAGCKTYLQASTLLALLAALGTTGYSLIDDHALRLLRIALGRRAAPGLPVDGAAATVLFAFLEGVTSSFWLALFVLAAKQRRTDLARVWREQIRPAALAGLGIYLGYTLVLVAMGFVRDVSYVVAFRQLSIPLGALVGVLVLKEPSYALKWAGVGIMFAGLVLVGIG